MTMQMSVPIETGTRFPALPVRSQVRRFGQLFLRNLWRSGVMPLLPVVIAIGVWYSRLLIGEGVVLWSEVSISIAMVYAIVGPLCAGLAAWSSGRSRRRHMDDQLQASALPGWQQDLVTFATAAGIGILGYAGMMIIILGWSAMKTTWGSPYGVVLLSGLCVVVLFSLIGAAIGMVWPNHLASLLAMALTGGSVALGNTIQNYSAEANARELTLWNTLLNLRDGFNPWVSDRVVPELYENMLMITGLGALVVALVLALRHRSPFLTGALILAVIWATTGVFVTATGSRSQPVAGWMASETTASFAYACNDRGVIDVCLHPAWGSVQPLVDEMAEQIYTLVSGLGGVPSKIVQISTSDLDARGDGTFYMPSGRIMRSNLGFSLVATVFPEINGSGGVMSDAEMVIVGWLLDEAGANPGMLLHIGPRYQASAVARQQDIEKAIDRFSALPPEQQHAWLEANWDALRAGELTLKDLP